MWRKCNDVEKSDNDFQVYVEEIELDNVGERNSKEEDETDIRFSTE